MTDYLEEANDLREFSRAMRRDFHRNPELGFREVRTAGIVYRELNSLGLEVTTGIAQTGVCALLKCSHPGPVLLLRFDMDALPVQEQTGVEYASQNPGVMHACGHDGHTAIGLTVARLLHKHRQELSGTIKLVFQPAEEGLGGAKSMIAEGILTNPKPDIALAMHLWNEKPVGWLGVSDGPTMTGSDIFTVHILGKGGHGGLPHQSVDPIVAAGEIIGALQTVVARNVSPLQAALISITAVHGGEAYNVIPPEVILKGTIRTFEPTAHQLVIERFQSIVGKVAEAMNCQSQVEIQLSNPAVVNNPKIAAQVRAVAARILPDNEIDSHYQTMVAEDMAYMLQEVPGCFFFVGSANPAEGLDAGHHHPRFNFDEQVLPRASALIALSAAELLK